MLLLSWVLTPASGGRAGTPLPQAGHPLILTPLPGAPTRGSLGGPACWACSRTHMGRGPRGLGQAPRHLTSSGPGHWARPAAHGGLGLAEPGSQPPAGGQRGGSRPGPGSRAWPFLLGHRHVSGGPGHAPEMYSAESALPAEGLFLPWRNIPSALLSSASQSPPEMVLAAPRHLQPQRRAGGTWEGSATEPHSLRSLREASPTSHSAFCVLRKCSQCC